MSTAHTLPELIFGARMPRLAPNHASNHTPNLATNLATNHAPSYAAQPRTTTTYAPRTPTHNAPRTTITYAPHTPTTTTHSCVDGPTPGGLALNPLGASKKQLAWAMLQAVC